jgi:hypothetical protein
VIRVGSLFSGVGALDMAVRQALGAEPVPSESWSEPSVTWPRSGTWDRGAAYERPRSAPLIDGTEVFTLAWPASDTDGAGRRSGRGLAGRTGAAVERDGAPAAADATGERRDEGRPVVRHCVHSIVIAGGREAAALDRPPHHQGNLHPSNRSHLPTHDHVAFTPIRERAPYARADGSTAGAGVLVADTRGVLVPGRFVERSASAEASFSHLIAVESLKVGQIPQPDGLVVAGGGQGEAVRGERQLVHLVGVAGQGCAELVGSVPVAEILQPDSPVGAASNQGPPVRGKRHPVHPVRVAGQGCAELVGSVPVAEIP